MDEEKFNKVYDELDMEQKLIITKDTLRFLVDTNEPTFYLNQTIKDTIQFVSDELEYSLGLK